VLPETLPEELMSPLETFWHTAMARAEANYQKFKQELQERHEEIISIKDTALLQLKERSEAYHQLETRLNDVQAEKDLLKASHQHLEGELKASQVHIAEIKEQAVQSIQLANSRMQDHQRQIKTLEAILASQKEDDSRRIAELVERIQDERKRGEDAESRLMVDIDTLRQNIKQKDVIITTLEQEIKTLSQQSYERQAELQAQKMSYEKSEKELLDKVNLDRETIAQAEKREINLQKQLNDFTGIFEQMQQTLNEARSREIALSQQVTTLEARLVASESALVAKKGI
jgi:chromosome segregation ATPase